MPHEKSMSRLALSAIAACFVALASCGGDEAPTRVVVRFETDIPAPTELASIGLELHREGVDAPFFQRTYDLHGPLAFPGDVVVTAQNPADARRLIASVHASVLRGTSFTQRAITRFERGRTLYLQFFIARRCSDMQCPRGMSCGHAGCQPDERDATPTPIALDAGSFDVTAPTPDAADVASTDLVADVDAQPADLPDAAETPDRMDVADVVDVRDAVDVADVEDVRDAADVADVVDVRDAADVAVDVTDVSACPSGMGDCNDNPMDGCEVNTTRSVAHCGGCNVACPMVTGGAATCVAGVCGASCGTAGTHACGPACVSDGSPDTCGDRCDACPVPPGATGATCVMGACGVACAMGFTPDGARCLPSPPRPLAPLSTSRVTRQQPVLRWALPSGVSGAYVQVCEDRACSVIVQEFDAMGASSTTMSTLARGVYFWRLYGLEGGVRGTTASPTWEFFVGARSATRDSSWGAVPDFNGDGHADLAVARVVDGSAEVPGVLVFNGPITPASTRADASLLPSVRVNQHALAVGSAGDVDGDGFGDLVTTNSQNGGGAWGALELHRGSARGLAVTGVETWRSTTSGLGVREIVGLGDVNADGYADLGVGCADAHFLVFLGGPRGLSATPQASLNLGPSSGAHVEILGPGDVDGDGFADLVCQRYAFPTISEMRYYRGGATGIDTTVAATLFGAFTGSSADVNGDGFPDLLAGTSDRLDVYYGGTRGPALGPDETLRFTIAGMGANLSGVGDATGDGYDDVLAATNNERTANTVGLLRGGASGLETTPAVTMPLPLLMGVGVIAYVGVTAVGDLTGDHLDDFVVGAVNLSTGSQVFLHPGVPSSIATTPLVTIRGPVASYFGNSIAAMIR